ncbi:ammonium transporter, Amt family [Fistulifera solaris]|uniref:Ammonium transporter n=1 Tax=Fistulifera solaris TaxID=1519565 RepID=A0A1Z5JD89_FISSO|nr:ammonium transporter, Amt family [Fistulifera solaris]|eukprot:GAX11916.1 ammonium transporter, Amt family [Fistulifera solaris]
MSNSFYSSCAILYEGETDAVLQCITDKLQAETQKAALDTHTWLLVLSAALLFFMQAGFAVLCAGCVRKKNVQNTMLKNLLDACGAALAWYTTGYAFAFGQPGSGETSFIGTGGFLYIGDVDAAYWFFQYAFSATAVTIVAGTLAERCQMTAYLLYSLFLTGFVYPMSARAMWSSHGFLSAKQPDPLGGIGAIDFAGSGVVHITGGMTALIAAKILGARKGRFYDSKGSPLSKPKHFPGHSIALQLMGTMMLWFGWYGFNPGSALLLGVENSGPIAALAAINTSISGASGAITAMFTELYLEERRTGGLSFNLTMAMNGLLSGLVAVTASCALIEPWAAGLIGMTAGWIYVAGSSLLIRWRIDDAVDAIPVHLFSGVWGMIATGLFTAPTRILTAFGSSDHVGWFYSLGRGEVDATLLGNQILAVLFLLAWPLGTITPFFLWLNYMKWLRSDTLEELVGLDMAYHVNAPTVLRDDDVDEKALAELEERKHKKRTGQEGAP